MKRTTWIGALIATTAILGTSVAAVPAVATTPSRSDRFGVYNWDVALNAKPSNQDALTWASNLVAGTGTHTIRLFLGTKDVYQIGTPSTASLSAVASQTPYANVFSDSRLTTYVLTTYSNFARVDGWKDGVSSAEASAERSETADLARYLLDTYPTKTFILSNWEGDNAVNLAGGTSTARQGFADWSVARIAGINDAKASRPTQASRLKSALEYNAVTGCGTTRWCVLTQVAPLISADYYSYSSWEAMGTGTSSPSQLTTDLQASLAAIQTGQPSVTAANIIVGEFGLARDIPQAGECAAAAITTQVMTAIENFGASYGIFWQIVDNPVNSTWNGFGLYRFDGSSTLTLPRFSAFIQNQTVTGVPSSCPNIGGVANAVTNTGIVLAGDVISLYGSNFSTAGNKVVFQVNGQRVVVGAGTTGWYQSPTQINVKVPTGTSGGVVVTVIRADGIESNGNYFTLTP